MIEVVGFTFYKRFNITAFSSSILSASFFLTRKLSDFFCEVDLSVSIIYELVILFPRATELLDRRSSALVTPLKWLFARPWLGETKLFGIIDGIPEGTIGGFLWVNPLIFI